MEQRRTVLPIKILNDQVAARIAAGEVIERPASVVKELIENAIDAGSTRITINIKMGGRQLISVTDNGSGINPDEIETAFQRFATSKIDENSNLLEIKTLGFRGEALPSIASISELSVTSKVPSEITGVKYFINFGKPGHLEPFGSPLGTTIKVSELFKNTPAREKFLSSPPRELARISEIVSELALVHPNISFTLVADDKSRIITEGQSDGRSVIGSLWGINVARSMLLIEPDPNDDFNVSGFISDPSLTRANRKRITTAVNGRLVHNRRLSFAVEQAYHGYLPQRRYPLAVLNIQLPIDEVDVNVHPSKFEVRFLRERLVFKTIQSAIRLVLNSQSSVKILSPMTLNPITYDSMKSNKSLPYSVESQKNPTPNIFKDFREFTDMALPPLLNDPQDESITPVKHSEILPILRVIGQTRQTYIVAEGPTGIYIIDQHAAHERVLFEDVSAQFKKSSVETQPLLEPHQIELSPTHFHLVEERKDELKTAGFTIEPFGGLSIIIRAIPAALANAGNPGSDLLVQMLDGMEEGRPSSWWTEHILATIACHSAIRAGKTLSKDEMSELIHSLENTEQPRTCPHGRPTVVHIDIISLEKNFGRR